MTKQTVFRDYDQAGLDAQYNNRARFPDFVRHFESWSTWSAKTRATLPCRLDIPYGDTAPEKLDVFPAAEADAPIYVFIHGGYWYSLDKSDYSYIAEGMRPHGVATAVINHGLAPAHDMDTIVAHSRRALAWLWRNAASFGADASRIYICGHSAGGHLAMMLLATDWPALGTDLPGDIVKGVCPIGGIFDLEPIRLCYLNEKLHMDAAMARRNSPMSVIYRYPAPMLLVIAIDESEEFHRQSREMEAAWRARGWPVELTVPQDLDHFSVVNDMIRPDCPIVLAQLDQMKLAFGR
ncbi:MAG: alpha/beta hydrolase [Alphaproteobacteria bacterium]